MPSIDAAIQRNFKDLRFERADLAEISRGLRGVMGDIDSDIVEAVALMIAAQQLDLDGYVRIRAVAGEAAACAQTAAKEMRKAYAALNSIPATLRPEFKLEGILKSVESWDRLAVALGQFADLTRPKRRAHRPRNAAFWAFARLLAWRYRQRTGAAPPIPSYSDGDGRYRGAFFEWEETIFSAGMRLAEDWGCARPGIWPPTPNARGAAIRRALKGITF